MVSSPNSPMLSCNRLSIRGFTPRIPRWPQPPQYQRISMKQGSRDIVSAVPLGQSRLSLTSQQSPGRSTSKMAAALRCTGHARDGLRSHPSPLTCSGYPNSSRHALASAVHPSRTPLHPANLLSLRTLARDWWTPQVLAMNPVSAGSGAAAVAGRLDYTKFRGRGRREVAMGSVVTDEPSTLGKRGRICWGAGLNTIAVVRQRRAGTFDLKVGEKFSPPYILPCLTPLAEYATGTFNIVNCHPVNMRTQILNAKWSPFTLFGSGRLGATSRLVANTICVAMRTEAI